MLLTYSIIATIKGKNSKNILVSKQTVCIVKGMLHSSSFQCIFLFKLSSETQKVYTVCMSRSSIDTKSTLFPWGESSPCFSFWVCFMYDDCQYASKQYLASINDVKAICGFDVKKQLMYERSSALYCLSHTVKMRKEVMCRFFNIQSNVLVWKNDRFA